MGALDKATISRVMSAMGRRGGLRGGRRRMETMTAKERSRIARKAARARWRKGGIGGGGRPRSDAPRCPCGAMTAKRAKARSHQCGPPGSPKPVRGTVLSRQIAERQMQLARAAREAMRRAAARTAINCTDLLTDFE